MYAVEDVAEVCPCPDGFEEDKKVKELMSNYGIGNVRGGSYSNLELSAAQQQVLQLELAGATDRCLSCGAHDDFLRNCPQQVVSPSLSYSTHLPQQAAAQLARHSLASPYQPSYPPNKRMRTFVDSSNGSRYPASQSLQVRPARPLAQRLFRQHSCER